MNGGQGERIAQAGRQESEPRHQGGGRQGKARPGGQRAQAAGSPQSDQKSGLTARRSGQELAERHDVGIVFLGQPSPLVDEGAAKIAEVGDGAAEGGQTQPQKRQKHLPGGAATRSGRRRGHARPVSFRIYAAQVFARIARLQSLRLIRIDIRKLLL